MRHDARWELVETLVEIRELAFVPEVRLRLATDTMALWEETEAAIGSGELPPPFWATAWPGGLALARYVLDDPAVVVGRHVVDVATGSGIAAIAAALAGAPSVTACDIDEVAVAAAAANAEINGVRLTTSVLDVRHAVVGPGSLVLAGDVFYEREIAAAMTEGLGRLRQAGAEVLVGDPYRSFLPDDDLDLLAVYEIPVDPSVEGVATKETVVARFAPTGGDHGPPRRRREAQPAA